MIDKITFNHKLSCVMIFLILYFSQSLMFRELASAGSRTLFIIIIWGIILLFSCLKKNDCRIGFNKKQFLVFSSLVFCLVFSCMFNGFDITFDGYTIVLFFLALMLVSTMEKQKFIKSYIDVMCFIGLMSSMLFLLYKIIPRAFDIFPDYFWHSGMAIKNCYLCVIPTAVQNYRNFGIFYEPGMFSVFLIWALMFALFHTEPNLRKISILLIALGTTLSTNGYLCGAALMMLFIFGHKKITKKQKRAITIMIIMISSLAVFYIMRNPNVLHFLTDKFREISIKQPIDLSVQGSGYERWRSVVFAIECFFYNPLLGVAQTGWQIKFRSVIGTATPINWFGLYGFVYGAIISYLYCRSMALSHKASLLDHFVSMGLVIIGLMNIMTQNFATDLTIFMIVLYAVADDFHKKQSSLKRVI